LDDLRIALKSLSTIVATKKRIENVQEILSCFETFLKIPVLLKKPRTWTNYRCTRTKETLMQKAVQIDENFKSFKFMCPRLLLQQIPWIHTSVVKMLS